MNRKVYSIYLTVKLLKRLFKTCLAITQFWKRGDKDISFFPASFISKSFLRKKREEWILILLTPSLGDKNVIRMEKQHYKRSLKSFFILWISSNHPPSFSLYYQRKFHITSFVLPTLLPTFLDTNLPLHSTLSVHPLELFALFVPLAPRSTCFIRNF